MSRSAAKEYSEALQNRDWLVPITPNFFHFLLSLEMSENDLDPPSDLFLYMTVEDLEQWFHELPFKILIFKIHQIVAQHGSENGYVFFLQYCEQYVQEQLKQEEIRIIKMVNFGDMVNIVIKIEQSIQLISSELPFKWLSKEKGALYLSSLYAKKEAYENLFFLTENIIDELCEMALPGVILIDKVKEFCKQLVPLLRALPEIRPITWIRYFDKPYIIKKIHNRIIDKRVRYLQNMLTQEPVDLNKIKEELNKMTVYRVRRNVIEKTYDSYKIFYELGVANPDQEIILSFLQEEFIRCIHNQIKQIPLEERAAFLNFFQKAPILEPILRKGWFVSRNSQAKKQYQWLMNNSMNDEPYTPLKELELYDIDTPIEVDVMGELVRELVALTTYRDEDRFSAVEALRLIEKTYKNMQTPYFSPPAALDELAIEEEDFFFFKKRVAGIRDPVVRRAKLAQTYKKIKNDHRHDDNLARIRKRLLSFYLEIFQTELDNVRLEDNEDKCRFYVSWLQSATMTSLWQDSWGELDLPSFYEAALRRIMTHP